MALKDAIYTHLINDSNVTTLLGTFASTPSVFLSTIPKSASLPAITFQQISSGHERHLNGGSGLADADFQINCYSTDALEVESIADALRVSMDNHRGTLGVVTTADVKIAKLETESDDEELPNNANEIHTYSKKQTWSFSYTETKT